MNSHKCDIKTHTPGTVKIYSQSTSKYTLSDTEDIALVGQLVTLNCISSSAVT